MDRKRADNIELLRVIIMFFIVVFHFICHGMKLWFVKDMNVDINSFKSVFNYSMTWYIAIVTSIAVNTYVLITGFFLGNSLKINLLGGGKKIIKVLMPTIFYTVTLYIVYPLLRESIPSFERIISSVFPIYNSVYWFVTKYVALIALSPIINILLNSMNKRLHLYLVTILLIVTCEISPTIGYCHVYEAGGGTLLWFLTLYTSGSYISRYKTTDSIKLNAGKLFFAISIICTAIYLARNFYKMQHGGYTIISKPHYNSIAIYALSCLILIWASNLNLKNSILKKISGLGYLTFGVYLIHDNPFVREKLWNKIINPNLYVETWYHIPYMILVSVIIFIICCIIERIRIIIFTKLEIDNKINNQIQRCYERIKRK